MQNIFWTSLKIPAKGLGFLMLYEDRCHPLKKGILFYDAIFFVLAQPTLCSFVYIK